MSTAIATTQQQPLREQIDRVEAKLGGLTSDLRSVDGELLDLLPKREQCELVQNVCDSLELFAREVMPEFHAAEAEHAEWKRKVLGREIVLEDLDVQKYDIYSHQNEHIVRLTPEQLKAKMAEKEAAKSAGD